MCVCAAGVGVRVAFSLSALALLISCQSVAVGSCQVCQLLPEPSPANLMPPAAVRLDVCPPLSASFHPSIRPSTRPSVRLFVWPLVIVRPAWPMHWPLIHQI